MQSQIVNFVQYTMTLCTKIWIPYNEFGFTVILSIIITAKSLSSYSITTNGDSTEKKKKKMRYELN